VSVNSLPIDGNANDRSGRRRILFITPDLENPPTKGYQVRCLAMASGLGERYVGRVVAARASRGLSNVGAADRPLRRLQAGLGRLVDGAPLQSALFDGDDVASRFRQVVEDWRPDAIVVMTERLPVTTAALREQVLLVDVVDPMSAHMTQRASRASFWSRWLWTHEAKSFMRHAHVVRQCATKVIASSSSALTDYPDAVVIPNAATLDPAPRPPASVDVIFTGNLSYWPNVKAAVELCERIAPRIKDALPEARIAIAGRQPTAAIRRACRAAGVVLMPNVKDMGSVLRASRLALAPIDWTPAANLKIMEALAAGTPVLAYPGAVAELPGSVSGVRTCEGPDEMAQSAIALLRGIEHLDVVTNDQQSWSTRAASLEVLLDSLLDPMGHDAVEANRFIPHF
jgi:glycosyltransferase involved in cell wall biosynthesis